MRGKSQVCFCAVRIALEIFFSRCYVCYLLLNLNQRNKPQCVQTSPASCWRWRAPSRQAGNFLPRGELPGTVSHLPLAKVIYTLLLFRQWAWWGQRGALQALAPLGRQISKAELQRPCLQLSGGRCLRWGRPGGESVAVVVGQWQTVHRPDSEVLKFCEVVSCTGKLKWWFSTTGKALFNPW